MEELRPRTEERHWDLFVSLKSTGKLPRGATKGHYTLGLSSRDPDFDHIDRICSLACSAGGFDLEIQRIEDFARSGTEAFTQSQEIDERLSAHQELEREVKEVKSRIKTTENRKEELVEAARATISNAQAKSKIIERLQHLLVDAYRQYLRADQRACVAAIENLWEKYGPTDRG